MTQRARQMRTLAGDRDLARTDYWVVQMGPIEDPKIAEGHSFSWSLAPSARWPAGTPVHVSMHQDYVDEYSPGTYISGTTVLVPAEPTSFKYDVPPEHAYNITDYAALALRVRFGESGSD